MKKVTRVRIKEVPYLPDDDPPEPWRSSLRFIQKNFLFPLSLPAAEAVSRIIEGEWACYMHYVYREKWNKKHKIPGTSKHTQLFGNYLLALLELCIQLHAIHPSGEHYKNAAKWFDHICWELKYIDRKEIYAIGGIKKVVGEYRRISYDYKAYMNPHSEAEPHLYRLIDAVIHIHQSEKAPNLINTYWKAVINSLTAYTTFLDKEGATIFFIDNGQLWIQKGKGNNRVLVPFDCLKSII
jgi:hypothetical protein